MKWVRARDGMVFGVCKGMARSLDIKVGLFRLVWILSIFCFGAGLLLYLMLAVSLPREDRVTQALDSRLLGVCAKISLRTQIDVGIVRFLALCLAALSFGATIVGYVVLYFVMDNPSGQSSSSKPSTPPVTT